MFPHNMGLGAANDPDLMRRIGEITARGGRRDRDSTGTSLRPSP